MFWGSVIRIRGNLTCRIVDAAPRAVDARRLHGRCTHLVAGGLGTEAGTGGPGRRTLRAMNRPVRSPIVAARRRSLLRLGAMAAALAGASGRAHAAFEVTRWPARRAAPPLKLEDLAGTTWSLPALRGRVVLLNFWASWCEPCRAEMPALQTLAEFHGAERLVVLAINFKEPAERAERFVRRTGFTQPVLLDPNGDVARAWEVRVFPTSILVGVDGMPRHRVRGELDWTGPEAERLIHPLLKSG